MNKKGVSTIWMAIGVAAASALTFTLIFFFVTNLLTSKAMGASEFMASDLVAVIDTVSAAPGEVEILYEPPIADYGYPAIGSIIIKPKENVIGISPHSQDEMWTIIVNRALSAWGVGAVIRTAAEIRSGFDIGGQVSKAHLANKAFVGGQENFDIMTGVHPDYPGGGFIGMTLFDKAQGKPLRTAIKNDPEGLARFLAPDIFDSTVPKQNSRWMLSLIETGLEDDLAELVRASDAARASGNAAEMLTANTEFKAKINVLDSKLQDNYKLLGVEPEFQVSMRGSPGLPLADDMQFLRRNPAYFDQLAMGGRDTPAFRMVSDPKASEGLRTIISKDPANAQKLAQLQDGITKFDAKFRYGSQASRWELGLADSGKSFQKSFGKKELRSFTETAEHLADVDGKWGKTFLAENPKGFKRVISGAGAGVGFVGRWGIEKPYKAARGTVKFVFSVPGYVIKGSIWTVKQTAITAFYRAPKFALRGISRLIGKLGGTQLAEGISERYVKSTTKAIVDFVGHTIATAITWVTGNVLVPVTAGASKVAARIATRIEYVIAITLDFFFTTLPLGMAINQGHVASIEQYDTILWKNYAQQDDPLLLGAPNCEPDFARKNFDVAPYVPLREDDDPLMVPILLEPKAKSWGTIRIDNGELVCKEVIFGAVLDQSHNKCTGEDIITESKTFETQLAAEDTNNYKEQTQLLFNSGEIFAEDCACEGKGSGKVHIPIDTPGGIEQGDVCQDTPNYFISKDVGLGNAVEGLGGGQAFGTRTLFTVPVLGEVAVPVGTPSLHEFASWVFITAPIVRCSIISTVPEELLPGIAVGLACEAAVYGRLAVYYLSPAADFIANPLAFVGVEGLENVPVIKDITDFESIQDWGANFGIVLEGLQDTFGDDFDPRTTQYVVNVFTGSNFLDKDEQYYIAYPYSVLVSRECRTGDSGDVSIYREEDCKLGVEKGAI